MNSSTTASRDDRTDAGTSGLTDAVRDMLDRISKHFVDAGDGDPSAMTESQFLLNAMQAAIRFYRDRENLLSPSTKSPSEPLKEAKLSDAAIVLAV